MSVVLLTYESPVGCNDEAVTDRGICAWTSIIDSARNTEIAIRFFGDIPKGLHVYLIHHARWASYRVVKAIAHELHQPAIAPSSVLRQFRREYGPGLGLIHAI
jgi:hypothetical protein